MYSSANRRYTAPTVMEKLVFFLVLFTGCSAKYEADLKGKVFTFPLVSTNSYVELQPDMEGSLSAVTVCLRSFPDNKRANTLFSLATPSHMNAFLLYQSEVGAYRVHINDMRYDFFGLPDHLNKWNSVCWTWDSRTGITQVWVNGMRSVRIMLYADGVIAGAPSIILGQEQDTYGGGFDKAQCFLGELTDVHMWNYVLTPCEINSYMSDISFTPGNVLNWRAINYTVHSNVFVEENQLHACY
ncbi:serum amyloid P-component-like isoform X1 [Megalops cyprinoides]|uniref:serum amyloid P-component-like isoform X1 n=2 Tax=Megalops cyprinoides TaxID=118141 RepID=UPI00186566A3|nr:serum amyloid P-component-like isoform X1 [Megalops cyprinoides]